MARTVTYRILDEADGRFTVVAVLAGRVYRRDGVATRDEAQAWVEGLSVLMAALGAPVVSADDPAVPSAPAPSAAPDPVRSVDGCEPARARGSDSARKGRAAWRAR